jgi:outer membrane receptor protein involved in Fe transport
VLHVPLRNTLRTNYKEIRVLSSFRRASRALLAIAILCSIAVPASAAPPSASPGSIVGSVHDATTGVPLSNVEIHVVGSSESTRTDAAGRFTLPPLAPGSYRLSLNREGYQPAISETIRVEAAVVLVTLSMQEGANGLKTIAVTSTRGSDSLQQSSTFTKTLNAEELQRQGIVRAGDALRTEPGVNNGITGDTAALSDDINLSIRGIGTLETEAAIDGHPIGYGIKGGYNYQLSPVFPYSNISVLYGSGGSDLVGVNAIGGVINFQTLNTTPKDTESFMQGYGTFDQYATSLTATGTTGRVSYALAAGVSSLDGPFKNDNFYQTGAAYDQSVRSGPVYDLGVYQDDSLAVTRADLIKLQYNWNPSTSLALTSVGQNRWVDKTGNGDGDYLDYAPALAFGEQLLSQYSPSNFPKLKPCPKGTFVGTNANGQPNGYGPNGKPDGGITCQTPQEYAYFNTGWDGAGPSWQSLKLNDNALDFRVNTAESNFHVGYFNSYYENLTDRTYQLPDYGEPVSPYYPGNNASWSNIGVNESGAIVSDDFLTTDDDFELGTSYMNSTYFTDKNDALKGAPVITDTAYFFRDVWHPSQAPVATYANVWFKHSTATDTSYIDSRLSQVYRIGAHDQVRGSIGSTTTQPSANMLGEEFIGQTPGGAGGGAPITCGALNSIGSAPSTVLKPEDGVDEDLAYVHRWEGDTQAQLTVYNTNVYDKLYSTIVPLSISGTSFIPPAFLAQVTAAIAGKCGAALAPSLLGVNGNFNVGTLRAKGADLSGRYRLNHRLYFDYDYAVTSTALVNAANPELLEKNLTLIVDSQLPRLPLHTFNGSMDYTFSANNTKSLPAYDYSDFSVAYPVGHGITVSGTVLNLFNQWGSIAGLRYEGVALPLNSYAKPSAYNSYVGASSTEQFGLPFRTLYFSVQKSI